MVEAVERSGAAAFRGSFTQIPDLGTGSEFGTTWGDLHGITVLRGSSDCLRRSPAHLSSRGGDRNDREEPTAESRGAKRN